MSLLKIENNQTKEKEYIKEKEYKRREWRVQKNNLTDTNVQGKNRQTNNKKPPL